MGGSFLHHLGTPHKASCVSRLYQFAHTNSAHAGIGGIHVPASSKPTQAGLDMLDLA
jgi:hypothetical protein